MKTSFTKILYFVCIFPFFLNAQIALADQSSHYIPLLKEMFTKVAVEKNAQAISSYYCKDFELYSNGKIIKFDEYLRIHQAVYKTPIQYNVRYDEDAFVEQGNKVAGRIFITTKKPNEKEQTIEVILIAEYKDNKLYRLWELTYPDWSKMKALQVALKEN